MKTRMQLAVIVLSTSVALSAAAHEPNVANEIGSPPNTKTQNVRHDATTHAVHSGKTPGRGRLTLAVDDRSATGESDGADAGPSEAGRHSLAEVIVTAQKFKQSAFDVPISLAVVGGSELQKDLAMNMEDLQFIVPGVVVDNNGTNIRLVIRGINNFSGQQPQVGSYLNDADVTEWTGMSVDLTTYDLQRVEVLRGPQGTLYGDGSVGGTIRYITNQPDLSRVSMSMDFTALFDQYGAPGQRTVAVLNAPVVRDKAGLRLAAAFDHDGGWIDQPAANQKNVNGQDVTDVRIEGLWKPISAVTISGMQVIHRGSLGWSVGEDDKGNFTQVFNVLTTPHIQDNYEISNVTLQWQTSYMQIVNAATRYTHDHLLTNVPTILGYIPPPRPLEETYVPAEREGNDAWSDELRASNVGGGRWHWTVGGFYRDFTHRLPTSPAPYFFGFSGSALPTTPFPFLPATYTSKAISEFGDTSYRLFGHLTVGAGVRYFRDEEAAVTATYKPQPPTVTQEKTFASTDPRAYIRYEVTRNINIYASAAKGFRSGGFNSFGQPTFDPENVWTYELGSKMRFPKQQLILDGDVFWSHYGQYQVSGIALPLPVSITHNAGTARIKGIEADISWSPAAQWNLSLNGDYINARFVAIGVLNSPYEVGDPLDLVPRYQVAAAAERDFEWNGRAGFVRIQYSQTPPDSYRNRHLGPWYYSQSDYIYLLNFSTGIQVSRDWKVGVFGENLLNDRGHTQPDPDIFQGAVRERPRTFGVNVSATLD